MGRPKKATARERRLAEFINSGDWREKRRLAEQEPDLISADTSELLEDWIRQVEAQGDSESADELRYYQDFLRLARAEGISAAAEAVAEGYAQAGNQALERFHRDATTDALDDAVAALVQAIAATTRERCPAWWNSLGLAYSERYDAAGDEEDLDLAVSSARRAVQDTRPGDAERAGCLVNLGVYLLDRYDARGSDGEDLSAAEKAARAAVDSAGPDSGYLSAAWLVHARVAGARFDMTQQARFLDESISSTETARAVATTAAERAACAGTLGSRLLSRYTLTGNPADLDAAIANTQRALNLTPAPSAQRSSRLSNLGMAYLARYDRLGDIADLDVTILALEESAGATPQGAPMAGAVTANLGLALAERYERRRQHVDLNRAVEALLRAVELTPPRAIHRPQMLLDLGGVLLDRYECDARSEDLDSAIERFEQALKQASPASPEAVALHNRLSVALRFRFAARGDRRDLDRAVAAARRAVSATSNDSPLMSGWLDGLAGALRDRWAVTSAKQDQRNARDAYWQAARQGMEADPATALRSALSWESWASSSRRPGEAADAARLAVAAVRTLVSTQVMRSDKETWLRDATGLAGRAGLALACAGDFGGAVVAMETCRAILLDEALQVSEGGLGRLRDTGHAALVARLRHAVDAVHAHSGPHATPAL
jgi:hypothetical protein